MTFPRSTNCGHAVYAASAHLKVPKNKSGTSQQCKRATARPPRSVTETPRDLLGSRKHFSGTPKYLRAVSVCVSRCDRFFFCGSPHTKCHLLGTVGQLSGTLERSFFVLGREGRSLSRCGRLLRNAGRLLLLDGGVLCNGRRAIVRSSHCRHATPRHATPLNATNTLATLTHRAGSLAIPRCLPLSQTSNSWPFSLHAERRELDNASRAVWWVHPKSERATTV